MLRQPFESLKSAYAVGWTFRRRSCLDARSRYRFRSRRANPSASSSKARCRVSTGIERVLWPLVRERVVCAKDNAALAVFPYRVGESRFRRRPNRELDVTNTQIHSDARRATVFTIPSASRLTQIEYESRSREAEPRLCAHRLEHRHGKQRERVHLQIGIGARSSASIPRVSARGQSR